MRGDDRARGILTAMIVVIAIGTFVQRGDLLGAVFGNQVTLDIVDDAFTVRSGRPQLLDVLSNDRTLHEGDEPPRILIVEGPACGRARPVSGKIEYTSGTDCNGPMRLVYCVVDGEHCPSAKVLLSVISPDRPERGPGDLLAGGDVVPPEPDAIELTDFAETGAADAPSDVPPEAPDVPAAADATVIATTSTPEVAVRGGTADAREMQSPGAVSAVPVTSAPTAPTGGADASSVAALPAPDVARLGPARPAGPAAQVEGPAPADAVAGLQRPAAQDVRVEADSSSPALSQLAPPPTAGDEAVRIAAADVTLSRPRAAAPVLAAAGVVSGGAEVALPQSNAPSARPETGDLAAGAEAADALAAEAPAAEGTTAETPIAASAGRDDDQPLRIALRTRRVTGAGGLSALVAPNYARGPEVQAASPTRISDLAGAAPSDLSISPGTDDVVAERQATSDVRPQTVAALGSDAAPSLNDAQRQAPPVRAQVRSADGAEAPAERRAAQTLLPRLVDTVLAAEAAAPPLRALLARIDTGDLPQVAGPAAAPVEAPEEPTIEVAARTPQQDPPAPTSRPGLSAAGTCQPSLNLRPQAFAMIGLELAVPCAPGHLVEIVHGPLRFHAEIDEEGRLALSLPAFAEAATVEARFGDGLSVRADVRIRDLNRVSRVALVWDDPVDLNLHAREFGAAENADGHVWQSAPRSPREARRSGGGYLTALGPQGDIAGARAEVYTLPLQRRTPSGIVSLAVQALQAEAFCGGDLPFRVVRSEAAGRTEQREVRLALSRCTTGVSELFDGGVIRAIEVAGR
ncbi:MAG: hypothetical protein AAGE18_05485 [Pseudomonadota bacterium]